ncbi:hypothetical protein [Streptomyces griseoaurantiacus]|uniref:hypothetical protein n=1 Tax=Streptomyces griseoaurantiacus TaxID=68213 RepID=UPI0034601919
MTSHIDQLLARARLVNEPYPLQDIDDAAARIAARVARRAAPDRPGGPAHPAASPDEPVAAAQDLQILCETAVTATGALTHLRRFVGSLPEPCGARVLGCILQLTNREDAAQFWWQYAAGAGDRAATYCLYLQHLVHGERAEAQWWHAQTNADSPEPPADGQQHDVATTLRVLRTLHALRPNESMPDLINRLARAGAVFDYIPAAFSYIDDVIDLPLPDPDFTDHITALTASPPTAGRRGPQTAPPLPARTPRPFCRTRLRRKKETPPPSSWQWHDSGGAFGHTQHIGPVAAGWRRDLAWHIFWEHCETCADCDPAGFPCPTYTRTGIMLDEITPGSPPPASLDTRPTRSAPTSSHT